jgi:hypothetical protein
MDVEEIKRETIDGEHLRLLAIFHYVSGGLTILFSCVFIVHLIFMSFVLRNIDKFENNPGFGGKVDPEQFLGFFVVVFGIAIGLGILYGIAQIVSGRFIKNRRHRTFSLIVALPNIIFIPYGTILSILTLRVLDRRSVKRLYEAKP